jgi:hypothetical protein
MRSVRLSLAALSVLTLACGCDAKDRAVVAAAVDEPSGADASNDVHWVEADDGLLALRLSLASQTVKGGPIKITAQLRNAGAAPIAVLRPFGNRYFAEAAGMKVWNQQRRIRYSGETPGYELGASAFAVIPPDGTIEDQLDLTANNFAGIEKPGTYFLRYDYSYDGQWDSAAARHESGIRDVWRGTISSREIRITRNQLQSTGDGTVSRN